MWLPQPKKNTNFNIYFTHSLADDKILGGFLTWGQGHLIDLATHCNNRQFWLALLKLHYPQCTPSFSASLPPPLLSEEEAAQRDISGEKLIFWFFFFFYTLKSECILLICAVFLSRHLLFSVRHDQVWLTFTVVALAGHSSYCFLFRILWRKNYNFKIMMMNVNEVYVNSYIAPYWTHH